MQHTTFDDDIEIWYEGNYSIKSGSIFDDNWLTLVEVNVNLYLPKPDDITPVMPTEVDMRYYERAYTSSDFDAYYSGEVSSFDVGTLRVSDTGTVDISNWFTVEPNSNGGYTITYDSNVQLDSSDSGNASNYMSGLLSMLGDVFSAIDTCVTAEDMGWANPDTKVDELKAQYN